VSSSILRLDPALCPQAQGHGGQEWNFQSIANHE
jgi:hypothetical protein